MDHRSLDSKNSETLLGRALATEIHQFERARLRVSKLRSDLTFLKRCRDASIIPSFAKIKHPLHFSLNHNIFLKASLALIRYEISKVRRNLDLLSRKLLSWHLKLPNSVPSSLWTLIDARSALKSNRWEALWKEKQMAKFQKLQMRSSHSNEPSVSSASRVNANQVSALRTWIAG